MRKRISSCVKATIYFFALTTGITIVHIPTASLAAWSDSDMAQSAASSSTIADNGTTLEPSNCAQCHGDNVSSRHHESTYFIQGECTFCHEGVTTSGDCSTCHTFGGLQNSHHTTGPALSGDCSKCHSGAGNLQDCLSCHTGSIRAPHHGQAQTSDNPNAAFDCSACHPAMSQPTSCQECHGIVREDHHTPAEGESLPACSSCHTKIVEPQTCQGCHAHTPRGNPKAMATHHTLADQGALNCNSCHPGFDPTANDTGCSQCHASGNNRDLHHLTVMPEKGISCAECHSSTSMTGCTSCHEGTTQIVHHTEGVLGQKDCASCHSSPPSFDQQACRSCHHFMPTDPLFINNIHHETIYIWDNYQLGCYDCHTTLGGAFQPPPPDDCFFCHENVVNTPASLIQGLHHATPSYQSNNCSTCHSGVTASGLDCAGCHLGGNTLPPSSESHHATLPYEQNNCVTCHSGIGTGLNCSDCHNTNTAGTSADRHHTLANDPADPIDCLNCHNGAQTVYQACEACHVKQIPIATRHHMTLPAQMEECATCHVGVDATSLDCAVCHLAATEPDIAVRHHATATGQAGDCSKCHEQANPVDITCAACHVGDNPPYPVIHHEKPAAQSGNCTFCHSGIQTNGASCEECHTSPIPQIHHGDPLTNVGNDCSFCHESASTPDSCGNCHTSNPHHDTTASQTGECTYCHSVPAWATDRPSQAACRECHGQYMHNKGGPIKHFGACAACHNQEPFHPSPSSIPGYTRSAPGKRKFNIFWSQYAREEGPGERVYPNGEDMNDEGGRRIRDDHLDFATTQIEHSGKVYTVPYFTDGVNVTGLDLCTSCHNNRSELVECDNLKWREHLSAGYINQATYQLAEANYLGSLCGGGTSPPSSQSNLALNKSASASKSESGYSSSRIIDGDTNSRWWTRDRSDEWVIIDLGTEYNVNKVVINWHSYYAREYEIQLSKDNRNWTRVKDVNDGRGGVEEVNFNNINARYIKLRLQSSNSYSGFSIKEIEAYKH